MDQTWKQCYPGSTLHQQCILPYFPAIWSWRWDGAANIEIKVGLIEIENTYSNNTVLTLTHRVEIILQVVQWSWTWPADLLCSTRISVIFPVLHTSTYCCESAFSTMNMVKNKYRSTLTNEPLHQCLRLALTPFMPKLKAQKGVTFHTNKARPHHLLCIVWKFLLELCFWILTITVPDPGLNENLASGPFGFLIEYPWSSVCVCVYAIEYVYVR